METGVLYLKPRQQYGSGESKVMNTDHQNGNMLSKPPHSSPQQPPPSKAKGKAESAEKGRNGRHKKKDVKGGDVFKVHGNTIQGGKASKAGVFGFGNKYYSGGKKQIHEDDESSEEDSGSSEDEQ